MLQFVAVLCSAPHASSDLLPGPQKGCENEVLQAASGRPLASSFWSMNDAWVLSHTPSHCEFLTCSTDTGSKYQFGTKDVSAPYQRLRESITCIGETW